MSEVEVNGQIEAVCESMFSEMESQAVDALDLPVPGCFRMRSHSYVRAMDQGCSQDDDGPLVPASPPRTTTTVRTIQSSTGQPANTLSFCCYIYHLAAHSRTKGGRYTENVLFACIFKFSGLKTRDFKQLKRDQ